MNQIDAIINVFLVFIENDKNQTKMPFYIHLKIFVIKLGYMQDYSNVFFSPVFSTVIYANTEFGFIFRLKASSAKNISKCVRSNFN